MAGPGASFYGPIPLWTDKGTAISGAATFLSSVIDARSMGATLNLHGVYFGGMQGAFTLLGSNDYNEQTGVGNFAPVSGVSIPAPAATQIAHADGVTLATAHGASTADGVTVAGGPPNPTGVLAPLENPFWTATVTSATYGFTSGGVAIGDVIVISAGADSGTYPISAINSATSISVTVPTAKSFVGTVGQTIQVNSTLTGTLTSATGNFVTAAVSPGNQVVISAGGADLGTYQVLNVNSATVLLIATTPQPSRSYSPGRTAFVGASGLTYAIPGQFLVNVATPGSRFYMISYVNASSTGTLFGTAVGKGG